MPITYPTQLTPRVMRCYRFAFATALASLAALAVLPTFSATAANAPLPVVARLDLQRYSGTWHEIARLPNSFQKKCVGGAVSAQYTPLPSGEVSVLNSCRTADGSISQAPGLARRVPPEKGEAADVGHLQVRFAPSWLSWLPMVWGDYRVIDITEDYSIALVGTPDRQYLWLLARQPHMPPADVQRWLDKAAALGFDKQAVILTAPVTQP